MEWDLSATLGGDELWYAEEFHGAWWEWEASGAISIAAVNETMVVTVPVEPDPQPVVEIDPALPATIDLKAGQALDIPLTVSDAGYNHIGVQYLLDGTPLEVADDPSNEPEAYLIVIDSDEGEAANGIYRRQGTYNERPAYTNDNGYWIFTGEWDDWELSNELGGSDLDFSNYLTRDWEMDMVVLPSSFIVASTVYTGIRVALTEIQPTRTETATGFSGMKALTAAVAMENGIFPLNWAVRKWTTAATRPTAGTTSTSS